MLDLALSLKHLAYIPIFTAEALQICPLLTIGWNIQAVVSIIIIITNIPSGMYYKNLPKHFSKEANIDPGIMLCVHHQVLNTHYIIQAKQPNYPRFIV